MLPGRGRALGLDPMRADKLNSRFLSIWVKPDVALLH